VIADQLRYASCGYAGDAKAKTPVMDDMARSGANVHNAVASMPVCAAYNFHHWYSGEQSFYHTDTEKKIRNVFG